MSEDWTFSYEMFTECIRQIVELSDKIQDGWILHEKKDVDNGLYMTKKFNQVLEKTNGEDRTILLVVFEYHVSYSINYGVPVFSFIAWKQDGCLLRIEEYMEFKKFGDEKHLPSVLSQMDHPVLCKPFLTFHPCKTRELLQTFMGKSKNVVKSWLSVMCSFLDIPFDVIYGKSLSE